MLGRRLWQRADDDTQTSFAFQLFRTGRGRRPSACHELESQCGVTDYAGGRQAAHLSVFGPITGTSTPAEAFPEHLRKEGGTAPRVSLQANINLVLAPPPNEPV